MSSKKFRCKFHVSVAFSLTALIDSASHARQQTGWETHFYVEWHNHTAAFSAQITSSRRRKNCLWLLLKRWYDYEVVDDETFILYLNGKLWGTIMWTGVEVDTSLDALKLNYERDWSSERKFTFFADSIRETVQTVVHHRRFRLMEHPIKENITRALSSLPKKRKEKNLKIRKRNQTAAWKNVNASINPSLSVRA